MGVKKKTKRLPKSEAVKKGKPTSSGIEFGKTINGKSYVSLFYHRNTANPSKSFWHSSFSPSMEYQLFEASDKEGWVDSSRNHWGATKDCNSILGTKLERLSFFPVTKNLSDPWHGYPVSPLENGEADLPPSEIIELWFTSGLINRTTKKRIIKLKI